MFEIFKFQEILLSETYRLIPYLPFSDKNNGRLGGSRDKYVFASGYVEQDPKGIFSLEWFRFLSIEKFPKYTQVLFLDFPSIIQKNRNRNRKTVDGFRTDICRNLSIKKSSFKSLTNRIEKSTYKIFQKIWEPVK